MSNIKAQPFQVVFQLTSGCFTANGASSGSLICDGYSKLVGFITTDASLVAACGLKLRQSVDGGTNWDYVSASDTVAEGSSAACSVEIIGDAVKIDVATGDDEASAMRFGFFLRPI